VLHWKTRAICTISEPFKPQSIVLSSWVCDALISAGSPSRIVFIHVAVFVPAAKQSSSHSASSFLSSALLSSASAAPTVPLGSGASSSSVVAAQTNLKRRQREANITRELQELVRIETTGRRLK
jgi:hypothetical protein